MSRLKSTFAASVIGPKLRKKQAAAAERRAPALRKDDKLGRAEQELCAPPAAAVSVPVENARLVRKMPRCAVNRERLSSLFGSFL